MKKISYERIYQSQEYLSPLGEIHHRALFGGYTLAVDEAVFAMVSDGELYLRACEQSAKYCVKNASSFLTLMKRGRPVLLNYYRVDEGLWQNREKLLQLSRLRSMPPGKSATSAISVTGLKICRT